MGRISWRQASFIGAVGVLLVAGCDLGVPAVVYDAPRGEALAAGDINGDGHLDFFVGVDDTETGVVGHFMVGDGAGAFTPQSLDLPVRGDTQLADVNGDGHDDLLIGTWRTYDPPRQSTREEQTIHLLLNDGAGGFGPAVAVAVTSRIYEGIFGAYTWDHGDINGDGRLDLVILNCSPDQTAMAWLGDGAGGFGAPVTTTAVPPVGFMKVQLTDVNADGRDDLVSAGQGAIGGLPASDVEGHVGVGLSDGSGAFLGATAYRATDLPQFSTLQSLRAGDFDEDGDEDLIALHQDGQGPLSTLSLLAGNGDGTFAAAVDRALPLAARQVEVADLDGDGHLDLLLEAKGAAKVLFGDGTSQFPRTREIPWDGTLFVGDIDGDAKPDAAFRRYANLAVYLNGI